MSLFRFGVTSSKRKPGEDDEQSGSSSKKTSKSNEDDSLTKDQKYDREKRERKFQPHWKKDRPWLDYDEGLGLMSCKYCKKFPLHSDKESALVKGTKNLKVDPIKIHELTPQHISCQKQWIKDENPDTEIKELLSDTKLGQCILKQQCKPEQLQKYKVLFNTAYSIAKKGKPFTDYEFILDVQKKNGVDVGEQYFNIEGCKLFIRWIAQFLRSKMIADISQTPFISILSDGSTDRAVIEQEIVYIRFVNKQCLPITQMIGLMSLESGNADGILAAIFDALKSIKLDKEKIQHGTEGPKLICCNFDGASVNFGNKAGVFKKIKDEVPQAVGIHCIAHKLELAVLDANKSLTYMNTFETTLKGIFKFYYYSPKRRREVLEISDMLDQIFLHFGDVKQVRWLSSKERAVKAMIANYEIVVTHLEHDFVAGSRADDANRAKGYHTTITSIKFLKFLYFLMDFLPIVAKLSRTFQYDSYLIIEINDDIESAVIQLSQLKQGTGKYCKEFMEKFDKENKTFGKVKISTRNVPQLDMKTDKDLHALVDGTVKYIQSWFSFLKDKPFSLLQIFNFHQWPLGRGYELAEFGNEELVELVSLPEFLDVFTPDEREQIKTEWTELKLYLSRFRANPLLDMYSLVLQNKAAASMAIARDDGSTEADDYQRKLTPIELMIHWMMTVSPSTSTCERGFSLMNTLKSKLRTRLTQESLQNQLYIMNEGPSLQEFEPLPCIMYWFENSTRVPHCSGHKLKTREVEQDNTNFQLEASGK